MNSNPSNAAQRVYDALPDYLKRDIDQFLDDNPRQELYSEADIIEAFLNWNGVIGYSSRITDFFEAVHKAKS